MDQAIATLGLGFFLGLEHAFEADHMIAVTTMVTEHKNPFKAAMVGAFWGIGHTTTLFLVGILVLLLKVSVSSRLSVSFEFLVAIMLVFLGIRTLMSSCEHLHEHGHDHDGESHIHLHASHHHGHRKKSFIIGAIHGMAGSGALMVLVLATVKSTINGLYYILLFGAGSIAGMTMMSMLVGIPFVFSASRFLRAERYLKMTGGVLSICFGLYMGYSILFVEKLFVFQ